MEEKKQNSQKTNNKPEDRSPVVVILGHVDHGKTSILDYIRKTKIAEAETGGITQHIGAYQVSHGDGLITFIDTPGHEAFSAMRSRGVRVADIAVLVVAADDGVMPQTKEAISIIQKAKLPLVVAINKTDKPEADVQKVKMQLAESNILLEGFGGQVPNVEISAKSGQGIDQLLDMIALVAELEEFKYEDEAPMEAVVVESYQDPERGPTATLLVNKGILESGNTIAGTTTWAKVRQMESFKGESMQKARASVPAVVVGFAKVPQVGEKFVEVKDQKQAEARIASKARKANGTEMINSEEGRKIINLIVKSDVEGTLEAVRSILRSIDNEEIKLRVLDESVGEITESDLRLAASGNALVLGFRVKVNAVAAKLAQQSDVDIIIFETIYELVEGLREAVVNRIEPQIVEEVTGKLKVLKIFRTEPSRIIAGGKILEGEIKRGASVKVFREEENIGAGRLKQLKHVDKAIEQAKKGEEVGILFEGDVKLAESDLLEAVEKKKVKIGINAQS